MLIYPHLTDEEPEALFCAAICPRWICFNGGPLTLDTAGTAVALRPSADSQWLDIPPGVGEFCFVAFHILVVSPCAAAPHHPAHPPGLFQVQLLKKKLLSLPCWLCAGIWGRGDKSCVICALEGLPGMRKGGHGREWVDDW